MSNNAIADVHRWVLEAEQRSRPYLWTTPLEHSPYLSQICSGEVWLKLDLVQKTTSFKLRGAVSKIMSLSEQDMARGVLTASTGNYAFAIAEACKLRGYSATTYVAENISPSRLDLMRNQGLKVVMFGSEAGAAEAEARRAAEREGKIYVSPYNDPAVVGGQGTCGLEISQQLPDLDVVVAAVGGGGLIAGTGGWLKSVKPEVRVIGVSPANSPVMYESMKISRVVDMEILPTLADTCAGGVDQDAVTLDLCQQIIDDFLLLSEAEIENGIRTLFEQHRLVAEGSAAMGVAAVLKHPELFTDRKTVLVICGRNIDLDRFRKIIAAH